MPGSLAIAAFVLGAVLLLVAIVGGQFKVFAAEVSGSVGPVARGFAGVLGLVFVLVGLSKEVGEGTDAGAEASRPAESTAESRPAEPRPDEPDASSNRSGIAPPSIGLGKYDPASNAPAPNEPVANALVADAREEVLGAVRAAVDAASEAVNEQDGSGLDAHFEGAALAEVSALPAFVPAMLATQGADYAAMRAMGYGFASAFEITGIDDVEIDASGGKAEVAFQVLFRIRIAGNGACSQTRIGPGQQTYGLRRAGAGWRVHTSGGADPDLTPFMEGC